MRTANSARSSLSFARQAHAWCMAHCLINRRTHVLLQPASTCKLCGHACGSFNPCCASLVTSPHLTSSPPPLAHSLTHSLTIAWAPLGAHLPLRSCRVYRRVQLLAYLQMFLATIIFFFHNTTSVSHSHTDLTLSCPHDSPALVCVHDHGRLHILTTRACKVLHGWQGTRCAHVCAIEQASVIHNPFHHNMFPPTSDKSGSPTSHLPILDRRLNNTAGALYVRKEVDSAPAQKRRRAEEKVYILTHMRIRSG